MATPGAQRLQQMDRRPKATLFLNHLFGFLWVEMESGAFSGKQKFGEQTPGLLEDVCSVSSLVCVVDFKDFCINWSKRWVATSGKFMFQHVVPSKSQI